MKGLLHFYSALLLLAFPLITPSDGNAASTKTRPIILAEGVSSLLNIYHVIEVNPLKWPKVNNLGGKAFADFMISRKTEQTIGSFGVEKFGEAIFAPDADRKPSELGL